MKLIPILTYEKKEKMFEGTGTFHPVKTSNIGDNLSCIRQMDVNLWIYRKQDTIIAIDCGYEGMDNLLYDLEERLKIRNNAIQGLFITHGDVENAGGLCSEETFAPNATIYVHEKEEGMIRGTASRYRSGIMKKKNPVNFSGDCHFFHHTEVIKIDNVEIQCFHCPGHTEGHSVFLVDRKILFTGDSIAISQDGGHGYFDFFNMDTKQNIQSLVNLKEELVGKEPDLICTSHNGMCPFEKAFARINQVAIGTKKVPFDSKAPENIFEE